MSNSTPLQRIQYYMTTAAIPQYKYVTNCMDDRLNLAGDAIHDMQEAAKIISYKELVDAVGVEQLKEVFPDYDWRAKPKDLTLKKDWGVSFCKSVWRGIPCVYVEHSRIEYIFTLNGRLPKHETASSAYEITAFKLIKLEDYPKDLSVYQNPSNSEVRKLLDKHDLRGLVYEDGNVYVWDASLATHSTVGHQMGFVGRSTFGRMVQYYESFILSKNDDFSEFDWDDPEVKEGKGLFYVADDRQITSSLFFRMIGKG